MMRGSLTVLIKWDSSDLAPQTPFYCLYFQTTSFTDRVTLGILRNRRWHEIRNTRSLLGKKKWERKKDWEGKASDVIQNWWNLSQQNVAHWNKYYLLVKSYIGQKWLGPSTTTMLSHWLRATREEVTLTEKLEQILKMLQIEAVSLSALIAA